MKIPKLFKKAAAFVMAAVTALSIMPATAFAAGDIGTISFSHTYDSNGNAMRYNSSANIGGYTAGGTGNYKYRMFVDGENAFCIQPGVPLKTGNTLKKASSDTWNALSANQKKAVGLALLYGYQGNRNNLSGSDDEKWLATQTLVWEFVTGCREATGSYNQTSTTVYSLHFGSNYANSGARAVYDQIVAMLREHNTIPSFMSGGKNDITKELAYKDGKYSITLTDSNGVLSDYSFSSSDSNVSVSKSGNKLTISSTVAISGSVRITATGNHEASLSQYDELKAELENTGVVVLEDKAMQLEYNGDDITLIGLSDPSFTLKGDMFGEVPAMVDTKLRGLIGDKDNYTILLSHRPELFEAYVNCGVDLVLSGHAHGGQFRLPFIGGLVAPNQGLFPKYDAGLYTKGDTNMIVCRGLGNSIIPIRFNNRPEIVLLELIAE